MGKGSTRRPGEGYEDGWERIFGRGHLLENIIDDWYTMGGDGYSLKDYLGFTDEELANYIENEIIPPWWPR